MIPAAAAAAAATQLAPPAREDGTAREDAEDASDGRLHDVTVGQRVTVACQGRRYDGKVIQIGLDSDRGRIYLVHYHKVNEKRPVEEWVPLTRLQPAGQMRISPRNNASTASRLAAASSSSSAAASSSSAAGPSGTALAIGDDGAASSGESRALVPVEDSGFYGHAVAAPPAGRSNAAGKARASAVVATSLPEGWATAAAAETLREFGERKFFAADWFNAFAAHAITKKSGEPPNRLLALFVVAVNDLQMLGLCNASKRPRGTIEKRYFG